MARRRAGDPPRLDDEQLMGLRAALSGFDDRVGQRGLRYVDGGRVGPIDVFGAIWSADVSGTEVYDTYWNWRGTAWDHECSCPVAYHCKHAYALAVVMLRGAVSAAAAPASVPPRDAADATILAQLRATTEPWRRHMILAPLLRCAPEATIESAMLAEILREPDCDLLCWRLAALLQRSATKAVPPWLRAFSDRADLAQRASAARRAAVVAELAQWAERRGTPPARRLRLVVVLAPVPGGVGLGLEVRVTSPRIADAPRTLQQLLQLRSELLRAPGHLPSDQAAVLTMLTDGDIRLVEGSFGLLARFGLPLDVLLRLARRVADADLATWVVEAEDAGRRGDLTSGAPLRFDDTPVRLLPVCQEAAGDALLDLAFHWPDGRQLPVREGLYFSTSAAADEQPRSGVLIAGGVVYAVPDSPKLMTVRHFVSEGPMPVPADERRALIASLLSGFPHLRETLAAQTRLHDVAPLLALDLRDEDWLHIRLLAHRRTAPWAPGGPLVTDGAFEYRPEERWDAAVPSPDRSPGDPLASLDAAAPLAPADAPPSALADAPGAAPWWEEPDPARVDPAREWLASLPARSGSVGRPGGQVPSAADRDLGWWMHASPRNMQALADAWAVRPPELVVVGTVRVRRLLVGTPLRPRLRVAASGTDWFEVSADWQSESQRLDDADLLRLRAATTTFVRLSGGWVRRDSAQAYDETAALCADLGLEVGSGPQRLSVWQLAGAAPESLATLERLGGDAETAAAARTLRERVAAFAGLPRVDPPAALRATLRPYQQRGFEFLVHAATLGLGAVLADDMGLGKTLQALTWLQHLYTADPLAGPSLVVCPASVVHIWAREAERFAPTLRVLVLTRGGGRQAQLDAMADRQPTAPQLVVTNYALLRRDAERWRAVSLRALIFDEAQNLKNPDADVTRVARTLSAQHRLALTGTPLENRALDLWSIVECVTPGYLGARGRFQDRFDSLEAAPSRRRLLAAKLRPILLRRSKAAVAPELPARIEERLDCELAREQRLLYLDHLRRSRALVDGLGAAAGMAKHRISILAALTRLRQICCHPALAGGRATLASGKFDALFELLEPLLAEGHKVLLFSQFVECLKLLRAALTARDVPCHMLTGASVHRERLVADFQADARPAVFLLSLKAAGTGLNLTAASYVVLFDPWWNPAVEAQAIDRAHRIGQDRTVIAYRLVARGTIEEKIFALQQSKAALAREVLGEDGFSRALTRDDLAYLFAET